MNERQSRYVERLFRIRNRNQLEALKLQAQEFKLLLTAGGSMFEAVHHNRRQQDRFNYLAGLAERMIDRMECRNARDDGYIGPRSEPKFGELVRREMEDCYHHEH